MNSLLKVATLTLISAAVLTVTGCNTTEGAFRGAGEDTRAAANAVGIDGSSSHHATHHHKAVTHQKAVHHKKPVHHKKAVHHKKTTTSTTTTTTDTTTTTAPAATQPASTGATQ